MHSMPAVTLSPDGTFFPPTLSPIQLIIITLLGKWLACQSMDNQILCYGVQMNFRLNRRKCFKGHNVNIQCIKCSNTCTCS